MSTPAPVPTPLDDETVKRLLEEWKTGREVLAKFDERIHDLSHWGIGFITALLTAESFLLPHSVLQTAALEPPIKTLVISVTLLLILSLRVVQRFYELFLAAAAVRTRAIEKLLGLDLTEVIAQVYHIDRMRWLGNLLYFFLAIGAGALGYFTIQPTAVWPIKSESAAVVIVLTVIVALLALGMRSFIPSKETMYWSKDRFSIYQGESLRITFTNISGSRGILIGGAKKWSITPQGIAPADDKVVSGPNENVTLKSGESYEWLWDGERNPSPGIYQIKFFLGRKVFKPEYAWPRQLTRWSFVLGDMLERLILLQSKETEESGTELLTIFPKKPPMNYCSNCGTKLGTDAKSCPQCKQPT